MVLMTLFLDGLSYGMILFIISVGLTVVLGLMRVVNLAHGAFAMAGGYIAAVLVAQGMHFALAAMIAVLIVAAVGALSELVLFRLVYQRGELAQALMTFGIVFVMVATLTTMFGADIKRLPLPSSLDGLVDIGFRMYPAYRLFTIVAGLAIAGALWYLVDRTLFGAILRASVDNPQMAQGVGINVRRLFTITFAAGCGLAALGGILGAELLPLEPYYALRYLVVFLVIVGVGGVGSFKGSFIAAILLGQIETFGKYYVPHASAYIFYGAIILILLFRPNGLIPSRGI